MKQSRPIGDARAPAKASTSNMRNGVNARATAKAPSSTVTNEEILSFLQGLAAGLEKLWKAQEKSTQLIESLAAKVDARASLEHKDIADLVQEEVARVYFDIAKVEQGEGNKLRLALIKRIEEKEKAQLSASVKEWIRRSFVPAVRKRRKRVTESLRLLLARTFEQLKPKKTPLQFKANVAADKLFRDSLIRTAFKMSSEWTIEDPSRPKTEPGHSKRSVRWWRDVNLIEACSAKPGTKAASLFKYVDSPHAYKAAKKQNGYEVEQEDDERDNKQDNKQDDERDDDERYGGRDDERYGGRDDERYGGRDDEWYGGRDDERYGGRDDERYGGRDDERYGGQDDEERNQTTSLFDGIQLTNRIGNDGNDDGEEVSQPDTHPEDEEAFVLPPARVGKSSSPSTLQVLLQKSNGVKRVGPGSYDVVAKKTAAKSGPSLSCEESEDENNESSLCSQLQAMLASPEPSPLLRKRKRGAENVGNTTQRELPPDAGRNDKRPRTSAPSSTQQPTVATPATQQPTVATPATQQPTVATPATQQPTVAAQAEDQADAARLTSLANVASTLSSSMQPGGLEQDEPTEAEIDSVCETSAPRKSNRKRVLTERARDITKQVAARVVDGAQEWLASITSAALPQTGVVRYAAALKQVGRNKLKQRISDLPDWASPPKPALKTVIMAATGATDIEWDPMEENGSIALDFEYEQPWMSRKNVKIYIGYKQRK